jgi:hypothetical protein
MSADDKDIIEMRSSESDDGELKYVRTRSVRKAGTLNGWIVKLLGIAVGVALFLLLLFFFVYVIIPLVLILILYSLLRNIFKPRR